MSRRYRTDFNERSRKGEALALAVPLDEQLAWLEEKVELYDDDGNTCQGDVTRMKDGLIYVALDTETWKDGPGGDPE